MPRIEVCETPDGCEVAVLDVAGYVVEPRVFASAEEADAWAAKLVAGFECEREYPHEPLGRTTSPAPMATRTRSAGSTAPGGCPAR